MEEQARKRILVESLPREWNTKPLSIAHEIGCFLDTVKDEGSYIDSGTDGASADLWVTIQGIEYYVNIKKSNKQLVKEGHILPPDIHGRS